MCELCKNKKKLGEICLDCHRKKIEEVKKEVIKFDNDEMFEHIKHLAICSLNFYDNAHFIMRIIKKELNKRHLSKKICPTCEGKGEVKSAVKQLDGYDLEDCPDCDGTGHRHHMIKTKEKKYVFDKNDYLVEVRRKR